MCDSEDREVDVIASGYEWICPGCNKLNKEIDYVPDLTCSDCKGNYIARLPEHCYGN